MYGSRLTAISIFFSLTRDPYASYAYVMGCAVLYGPQGILTPGAAVPVRVRDGTLSMVTVHRLLEAPPPCPGGRRWVGVCDDRQNRVETGAGGLPGRRPPPSRAG